MWGDANKHFWHLNVVSKQLQMQPAVTDDSVRTFRPLIGWERSCGWAANTV